MADSEKAPEQQQQAPAKNEGANDSATSAEEQQPKQLIAEKVTGTVKWFNVKSGYGFINRHDTKEDVFVHQTAILKNNPKKAVRSVGDGETVEFDVVLGDKGNEASNVTGPNSEPVQGSQFAPDKRRGRLYRPRRRTQTGGETGGEGDGGNVSGDGAASGDKKPRARRFRGQGQGQGQGQGRRFGGPGRFRRGGPRRSENGELNGGEGNEGGTGESGGEGEGNQNGRPKRFQNRRFRPRNNGPRNSENNADGGQQTEGGNNNENGQKPRRSRRFNRNKKNSGSNQDGGQEVQNTVTESQA